MSTPMRGRCLVINNRYFDQQPTSPGQQKLEHRDGSEMDVKNISKVFERLSFDCDIKTDLPAQVCLFGYRSEYRIWEHNRSPSVLLGHFISPG